MVSFCTLFLTGLILFVPPLSVIVQESWIRIIHRFAAAIFIIAPIVYLPMNWKAAWRRIREVFSWSVDDIGWLKAAPRYYILGDESSMPPQSIINTGQKFWWLIVLASGVVFSVSGITMLFFKTTASAVVLKWMIFSHDIAFIVAGAMLFLHIYLGLFHPMMTEAWKSIYKGTISVEYAKKHHARWYEEVIRRKEGKS
jgi:formate dehydrogenase subunit gamma